MPSLFKHAGVDRSSGRMVKFLKLSEGADNKKKRALEQAMLVPEPIPSYTGKKPNKGNVNYEARSISITFPDAEAMAVFGKHFRIARYLKNTCHDVRLLVSLLNEIEEGRIYYDENKVIRYRTKAIKKWKAEQCAAAGK